MLTDAFENFINIRLKIYEIDSSKFLPAPGLAWQAALKKTKVDLLTDFNTLLMVEKVSRGGLCQSIYRYAYRSKKSSYLQYWDLNNLYGWAMSEKLPVNNFEWIKDTF